MKHVWIAALVLSGACVSPPAPGLAAAEEKTVCRDEPKIGSLTGVKVCDTQANWDELKEKREAGIKNTERHVRANAGAFQTSKY